MKASVGFGDVLLATGVGVFLGTEEVISGVVFQYRPVWYESIELSSEEEEGECLVRADPTAVGAGVGEVSGVDMDFL